MLRQLPSNRIVKATLPDYEPGQYITVSCCPMSDSEEIVTRRIR